MGCLSLIFIASILSTNPIISIKIQGNRHISTPQIIETLGFSPPESLTDSMIQRGTGEVLSLYLQQGFIDAEITHEINNGELLFLVTEGSQYRIKTIEFSGNRFIKDAIAFNILGLRKGSIFNTFTFEKGVEDLLLFYGNNGFPFARIIPSSFVPEQEELAIAIEVEEGPRLRWGQTLARGNTITKSFVVQRQMRIPVGEYFSESRLRTANSWLAKLSFIESAAPPALLKGEKTGTVDVLVTVKEIKSNRVTGILGYIPAKENEDGGYIGIITTELMNLFGTARALQVSWEKQIPPYTKLDVTYTEPWTFGTRSHTQLSFYHLLEDTLYTISKAQAEVKTDISLHIALSLVLGWERFSPAAAALPPTKKYTAGTRFEIDVLDYRINPRKGILYSFYTEYGKKGPDNIMKFDLDMLNVISLTDNQSIALLIAGKATRTNAPPLQEYEQFALGGYESLRGYRERQFRASQMLRVSPEYRFFISRKSRIYAFYDSAIFTTATYPDNITEDHYRYGYGVGATFPAAIGIISIEYALGEEKTFLKGKIHLGLDTTF